MGEGIRAHDWCAEEGRTRRVGLAARGSAAREGRGCAETSECGGPDGFAVRWIESACTDRPTTAPSLRLCSIPSPENAHRSRGPALPGSVPLWTDQPVADAAGHPSAHGPRHHHGCGRMATAGTQPAGPRPSHDGRLSTRSHRLSHHTDCDWAVNGTRFWVGSQSERNRLGITPDAPSSKSQTGPPLSNGLSTTSKPSTEKPEIWRS
jgi:hypothetical protein